MSDSAFADRIYEAVSRRKVGCPDEDADLPERLITARDAERDKELRELAERWVAKGSICAEEFLALLDSRVPK